MNRRNFFKHAFGTLTALVVAPLVLLNGKEDGPDADWKDRMDCLKKHYRRTFDIDPKRLKFHGSKLYFYSV